MDMFHVLLTRLSGRTTAAAFYSERGRFDPLWRQHLLFWWETNKFWPNIQNTLAFHGDSNPHHQNLTIQRDKSCQLGQNARKDTNNLKIRIRPRTKTRNDLEFVGCCLQERQACQYETRCNGDLKLTLVFTTFGKVQNLGKDHPVSLPEVQKVQIPRQARGPPSKRKKSRNSNNCGSPDPTQLSGTRCMSRWWGSFVLFFVLAKKKRTCSAIFAEKRNK